MTPPSPIEPAMGIGSGPEWIRVANVQHLKWLGGPLSSKSDAVYPETREWDVLWDEHYFFASPFWGGRTNKPGSYPGIPNPNDPKKTLGKLNSHWCAAFVNYCLHRAGYSHTGMGSAKSFLHKDLWNCKVLKEPRKGCVIVLHQLVMKNGKMEDSYHVGFLHDVGGLPSNPKGNVGPIPVTLLGGNQKDTVTVRTYDNRVLMSVEDDKGVKSPYLWPNDSPGHCNMRLPTARPHFCGKMHRA